MLKEKLQRIKSFWPNLAKNKEIEKLLIFIFLQRYHSMRQMFHKTKSSNDYFAALTIENVSVNLKIRFFIPKYIST